MSSEHLSFITSDYLAVNFDDIKSSNDGDVCIAYIILWRFLISTVMMLISKEILK